MQLGQRAAGRSWRVAVVVAAAALLVGCSGSSDGAAPSTTGRPTTSGASIAEHDRTCAAAAALLYRDAAGYSAVPDPEADQPATTGLVPEQINAFLRDVAVEATGAAADDIATVTAATRAFADDREPYGAEARAAFDRIVVWAAGPCPPSKPVWACIAPASVGISAAEAGAPSPTAAGAVGAAPEVGQRVAMVDDPTVAAFGWVDDHQLVRHRVTLVREAAGWRRAKVTDCPG